MNTSLNFKVSLEFDNLKDAWKFRVNYGGNKCFGVRKHCHTKSKKDESITSYIYVCCKEGISKVDKMDFKTINPRPETRTGCAARMKVKRVNERYRLIDFIDDHNHPLHLSSNLVLTLFDLPLSGFSCSLNRLIVFFRIRIFPFVKLSNILTHLEITFNSSAK